MMKPAIRTTQQIARPLKVLVPLIQSELQQALVAGIEHYKCVGRMLIEAKEQCAYGQWGRWLKDNFNMSRTTAYGYMQMAELSASGEQVPSSIRDATGKTRRERDHRQSKQNQEFKRILRDVAADTFVQERQKRDDEIKLHRDLAEELIDIGYRALATKLHPDRGGSKDAMTRLNCVRDELKNLAKTRRFV